MTICFSIWKKNNIVQCIFPCNVCLGTFHLGIFNLTKFDPGCYPFRFYMTRRCWQRKQSEWTVIRTSKFLWSPGYNFKHVPETIFSPYFQTIHPDLYCLSSCVIRLIYLAGEWLCWSFSGVYYDSVMLWIWDGFL